MKHLIYILILIALPISKFAMAAQVTLEGEEYRNLIDKIKKCDEAEAAAKKKASEPPKEDAKPDAPQVAKLNINLHNLIGSEVYVVVKVKSADTQHQFMQVQGMSKNEITTFASLYGKLNIPFEIIPLKDDKDNEHIARAQYRLSDGTVRNISCSLLEQDPEKKPSKSVDFFVSIRENEVYPSCSIVYDYQP